MRGKRSIPLQRTCSICGQVFYSFTNRQSSAKATICDKRECRLEYIKRWTETHRKKPCPECGEPMFNRPTAKMCLACTVKQRQGPNHPRWKGGKTKQAGYIRILARGHHRADKSGRVFEHIKVWEDYYGRKLPTGWVIHHLNGIKDDNRIENLLAVPRKGHSTTTIPDMILDAYRRRIRQLESQVKELSEIHRSPLL